MKNKLFYLIGVASILCYTSTFTSCINGVDDEYLELAGGSCTGGGTDNEGDNSEEFNGEYISNGDFDLKMTYNGYELNGKKVAFTLDDNQESATLTMSGTELDLKSLAAVFEGMDAKFTTYSPIPGERELLLKNVKTEIDGSTCRFEGEDIKPNRIITFKGEILDGMMNIDIQHKFTGEGNKLLGKWKMGEVKEAGSGSGFLAQAELLNNNDNDFTKSSPLFLNWVVTDPQTSKVDMGRVPTGMDGALATIEVNRPMNGIFNLLMSQLVTSQLIKPSLEQALPKLVEFIAAEETGGMYISYSWNGTENPQYSQDMSHNIVRYYFDQDNQLRIEPDADLLLNAIGGLVSGATRTITTRDALPQNAIALAQKIVDILRPALEQGFPCEYEIDGDKLTINLDGKFLLDIMTLVEKLVNDEFVLNYINPIIDEIGDYAPNVRLLLKNLNNALGEKCTGIKLGFHLVKMSEETPEVPE